MYLTRIELQGFKSFADKTVIELPAKNSNKKNPLTAIVGPNGSGKSNVADALRWVLGEQSVKAVRGGKSEDVIFFGTSKRGRASFTEVGLILNNEDQAMSLDLPEVKICRRLYRDGVSEYLINGAVSRLMDIQMLLAKANFGKESYCVIAQGMIDHLLLMGGVERRTFFDEATGVHHLQIKKDQAIKKLVATQENLRQAKLLKEEIEPRLRSLTRQVKKLEEREAVEKEFQALGKEYFSALWHDLEKKEKEWREKLVGIEKKISREVADLRTMEKILEEAVREETQPEAIIKWQGNYRGLLDKRQKLKESEFSFRQKELLASQSQEKINFDPRVLFQDLESFCQDYEKIFNELDNLKSLTELDGWKTRARETVTRFKELLKSLKQDKKTPGNWQEEIVKVQKELAKVDDDLNKIQKELNVLGEQEKQKKSSFFASQKQLWQKQEVRRELERQGNEIKIELAKIGVEKNNLDNEMATDFSALKEEIKKNASVMDAAKVAEVLPQMQKLKRQLEWIGGLDPEVVQEYTGAKERYEFLENQSADLEKSLQSLVDLANELEENIKKQFEERFEKINQKFDEYFKILFNGGQAKLFKTMIEEEKEEEMPLFLGQVEVEKKQESALDKLAQKTASYGLEVQANPPGKKLKNINMLSGGEKALCSIALLSAILSVNPPPFLLLDEVDAALDEGNSARFARILNELAAQTQLLVITHNRATMQVADLLYGVAMEKEGVSKIISLKLEEGIEMAR